jgi:5-methylcytosine-specific restriction endonuclease McrA
MGARREPRPMEGRMSRWFRMYDSLLDDPKVQKLEPRLFKAALIAAMTGESTPFSQHLRPYNGRMAPALWAKVRARIYARDDYTCRYCGERGGRLECDHVVPLSKGGSDEDDNLVTACWRCNRSKAAKLLSDWAA